MSQVVFLTTAANPRTTVAILFFALSILVLFNSKLAELEKRLLFLIFILSCVVSHYSTTFIFFIVLLFTFICVKVICGLIAYQRRSAIKKNPLADELNITSSTSKITVSRTYKTYLTLGILVLFFVVVFLWYSQVTGAAFNNGVGFIAKSLKSMQNLFILESRDGNVAKAFGYGIEEMQVVRKASFIFNWLTIISIVIGVLTTLVMYRQRVALPYENEYGPSGFLSKRIDIEFLSLSLVCFFVMVASVVVPNISRGYGIDRAYMQMAVSLSLFFIIGAITAARFIHVKRVYLVVLIILIPFFMCTTGTLSQIFGYPQQIILNSDGPQYNLYYIHEQEAYACRWLGQQIEVGKLCYADTIGRSRLISQGGIRIDHIGDIASFLAQNRNSSGYIYLRYLNVVEGKFVSSISAGEQESSKSWYRFSEKDKILDCGGSEIWR